MPRGRARESRSADESGPSERLCGARPTIPRRFCGRSSPRSARRAARRALARAAPGCADADGRALSVDGGDPARRARGGAVSEARRLGRAQRGFDTVCDVLEERLGAERAVLPGNGHAVQRLGEPFNERARRFRRAGRTKLTARPVTTMGVTSAAADLAGRRGRRPARSSPRPSRCVLWASAFVGIRSAGHAFSPGPLSLGRLLVAGGRARRVSAVGGERLPAARRAARGRAGAPRLRAALVRRLQPRADLRRSGRSTPARPRCSSTSGRS